MSYDNDRPFSNPRRDQFANRLRVDRLRATLHADRDHPFNLTSVKLGGRSEGRIRDRPTYTHFSDIEEVRRLRFRGNLVIIQLVERRYSTYKRHIIPFN